jgi:hypothetical protein
VRFAKGETVRNKLTGMTGTVVRSSLEDLSDCVLVRFHDESGKPAGEKYVMPRRILERVQPTRSAQKL